MTRPDQGLPSLAPGGGKRRDPGNEVGYFNISRSSGWFQDVFEVRQHRVARCEGGVKKGRISHFLVLL